jgi:hypothetical protein
MDEVKHEVCLRPLPSLQVVAEAMSSLAEAALAFGAAARAVGLPQDLHEDTEV